MLDLKDIDPGVILLSDEIDFNDTGYGFKTETNT